MEEDVKVCLFTNRLKEVDEICNQNADAGELFLHTDTIAVTVPVCKRHFAVHNERAASKRRLQASVPRKNPGG